MTEMAADGFVSFHDLIAVVGIVFVAALVRSTFGFGDALVAMPLLLLVEFDHFAAVALLAATSLVTASVIQHSTLPVSGLGEEYLLLQPPLGLSFQLATSLRSFLNLSQRFAAKWGPPLDLVRD